MRAPDLLSLVIASGCCLVEIVGAQKGTPTTENLGSPTTDIPGPESISIVPSLAAGQTYAVTWGGCNDGRCTVNAFSLLQVVQGRPPTVIQSATSFTNIMALGDVNPSSTYEIELQYQTTVAGTPSVLTAIGSSFEPASTTATSSQPVPVLPTGISISSTPEGSTITGLQASSTGNAIESSSLVLPSQSSSGPTLTSGTQLPVSSSASTSTTENSGSSGLSTGAKVGIAIGAIGVALIVLIGALLIWRRRRQQQLRALPDGMPYSHDTGSTNRDLMAEKEINVVNSPVDTLSNGYSAVPSAPLTHSQPQTGSWGPPDEHSATSGAATTAAAVPYSDAHRRSYGSGYADSSSPGPEVQSATPPTAAASGSAIQRKPVGATSGGTTQHLREPGMSDEEVARLEEEERRLDEAIAEAERKRQGQS